MPRSWDKMVNMGGFIPQQPTIPCGGTDHVAKLLYFENHSAVPVGDTRALKPETAKKTGNKPMPFPSDPSMIMMANQKLKEMTKNIIWQNKGLITY
jgi:hypothetical protein